MNAKITVNPAIPQQLIAGILRRDNTIELFGIRKTKEVRFLQNGQTLPFSMLPPHAYVLLSNAYYRDAHAVSFISPLGYPVVRQVELYAYYCYGTLDHIPDIVDGVLAAPENFRDNLDCPSLFFSNKHLQLDGKKLLPREITIIDMIAQDCLDIEIAEALNITVSTLGFHKRDLFKKINCKTKTAVLYKAMQQHLLD